MSKNTVKLITLGGVRENGKNLRRRSGWFHFCIGCWAQVENEAVKGRCSHSQHGYLFENKDRSTNLSFWLTVMRMPSVLPYLWQEARYQSLVSELTIELARKLFVQKQWCCWSCEFSCYRWNTEVNCRNSCLFLPDDPQIPESLGIVVRRVKAILFIQAEVWPICRRILCDHFGHFGWDRSWGGVSSLKWFSQRWQHRASG